MTRQSWFMGFIISSACLSAQDQGSSVDDCGFSLFLPLHEVHNPILRPIGIFSLLSPTKEPAMPSVARRKHSDLRVALNQRPCEHGIGNKRIVLCRNDKGGNSKIADHVVRTGPLVVVGAAGVPSVRGSVAIVEVPQPGDARKIREIPLT